MFHKNNVSRHALLLVSSIIILFSGLAFIQNARADDAVVLVNPASAHYTDFQRYIQPYLDHFGIPYTLHDITASPISSAIADYNLIIIGHRQLDPANLYLDATEQNAISSAVSSGTGLVNFDNDLSADSATPSYQFIDDIFNFNYAASSTGAGVTFTAEGYSGIRVNCWEDDHQDPVLVTTSDVPTLVSNSENAQWTEFLYTQSRPYPSVMASALHTTGLPTMHFYATGIPNGQYEVIANLYDNAAMRYFFGYTESDPGAHFVETAGGLATGIQHREYSLGIIDITDNSFDLYVNNAQLITPGGYDIFGWAWIRLAETGAPPSEMHYITRRHEAGELISTGSMTLADIVPQDNMAVLATTGTQPFLAITTSGLGRAVQWGTYNWMSHTVKGPIYGLDDLVWRSMVWAARKPFAMQGLPPFVTMRVDDESGPFWWIEIANEFGIKPWAGLFFHNIDDAEAADLSALVNAGLATASIHAFNGAFFYFNHSGSDWPDATLAAYYAEGTQWHLDHNIPIARFMLPHYYEIGTNAFQGLSDWGVEFIGTMMEPGNGYGAPWIMNGPYRTVETGSSSEGRPVYYADFLTVPGHPEFNGQFFNCVTEIRDDAGYEWYPSSDVAGTIGRGTRQTKRALDSMALATLFTHGYFIPGIPPESWRAILSGITTNIASYNPIYVTLDHACQYVRAMHTSDILESDYDPALRRINATLTGETDMPTMFYLFTEEGGVIQETLVDVPAFSGSTDVAYQLAGPLDHITVSPNPATVATGGSRQFTAQGYDIDNNPIPALPFLWAVVNGGGAINSSGLFTAGTEAGTFTDTIEASYNGINGYATVEVVAPTLDHFTFQPILGPQYINIPFAITIEARDISGNLMADYTGQATLSESTGTIAPVVTGTFSNGIWTGEVTIGQTGSGITITAADGGASGTSNSFAVEEIPGYYTVTSPSYTQTAGVPFPVTVTARDVRINCWEDNHQSPVLSTFYDPTLFVPDDNRWDEFKYSLRDYPGVFAGQTENPGLMKFYGVVPNGTFRVVANLYRTNDFRYYYGFNPASPRAYSVDATSGPIGDFAEYDLGTVTITDNIFSLYTDDADVITDRGAFPYYGWAWVRLVPAQAEVQINCWEDDHQDPVLATTQVVGDLVATDGLWTEFLYTPSRPYPSILAADDEEAYGLPVMRFYASGMSNGKYEVIANLYTSSAGRDMRYYFGYSADNPKAYYVDTIGGSGGSTQHTEYSLGTVDITDGTFNIYVQDADMLGTGYNFFGWAWIRLVPSSSEVRINCWEDDQQEPVLATTSNIPDLVDNDGLWTEFLYLTSRPYPSILAGADEETYGLPVLRFYESGIPNGEYQVIANLYTNTAGRDMRYYYGYAPGNPKAYYVDTVGGSGGSTQHTEYSLGSVNITDGTFNIYVQDADMLGTGYNFFGWAWIRLVPADITMISMASSSPTMVFDGDGDGIFGEPGDDQKPLAGSSMTINAFDLSAGTDVTIAATDDLGQAGSNIYTILPSPECIEDGDCDDDDICNGAETCVANECVPGNPLVCDDGNVCNGIETCDPLSGCQPGTPLDCDDGDVCNGSEICDSILGCQAGTPLVCDDSINCTEDSCVPSSGCQHIANNAFCEDGQFCNGSEVCNPAAGCQPGLPVDCIDGVDCTDDSCDEVNDICVFTPNDANCNGNPCATGTCNAVTGCDYLPAPDDTPCDDSLYCNGADTCSGGICTHDGDPCGYCDAFGCTCDEEKDFCTGCDSDDDCDSICNPGESSPDCSGADNCSTIPNPGQEDTYPPDGNGIGDACDCEGDFTCDGDVDGTDAFTFKGDFGRSIIISPCTGAAPCNGDFRCDGDVDGSDAFQFKLDFGRSTILNPCPACVVGDWCGY